MEEESATRAWLQPKHAQSSPPTTTSDADAAESSAATPTPPYERMRPHDEEAIAAMLRNNQTEGMLPGKRRALKNLTPTAATLTHLYLADEPALHLVSSVWCFRFWPNGDWLPFAPADDDALEAGWRSLNTPHGGATTLVTADGKHEIRLRRTADGESEVAMRAVGASWNPFGRLSWYARRGWAGDYLAPLPAHEVRYEELPPKALVLVVHGIGETMWASHLISAINSLRDSVVRLRSLSAGVATTSSGGGGSGEEGRVEYLPVEWYDCLRGEGDETQIALKSVTPPSVPFLRRIASDVIMDVLFYQFEDHRRRMQEAAASRIGELVSRWHQVHPNFERDGGQIVLMGHSLGSLICFDLLSKERAAADSSADGPSLSTDVSACVALGSPVGCFLALRGQRPGPDFVLPRCPRYFNLYHRSDVVAYRLEPLLTAAAQPPAFVPFARGRDGQRLHVRLQQTIRDVQRKTNALSAWVSARVESAAATFDRRQAQERAAAAQAEEAASPMSSRSAEASVGAVRIALNAGERVDWIIQESELEAANEYLSATQAHQGYFVNEDVAAFVLNQVVGKGEAVGD